MKGDGNMLDLFTFYKELKRDGIIFCFSGPTSQAIVEGVGEALKQKMEIEETAGNTARNLFSVFVEQMQNVIHYSAESVSGPEKEAAELRYGIVIVGQEDDGFYVLSGNYIDKAQADEIGGKLRAIQKMSKEEMKAYFKEQRRKEPDPLSKGAGLGFIETARKASKPITFAIDPVDDTYCFFTIKAII
jgi:hypothetical protein